MEIQDFFNNVYTFTEAAEKFNLKSTSTLRKAVQHGRFAADEIEKRGKVWLVKKSAAERLYGNRKAKSYRQRSLMTVNLREKETRDVPDLIKLKEIRQLSHYGLHKSLFTFYREKLSLQAKVLYSILCYRLELSIENNWCDEQGYAYLIFPRDEMAYMLNVTEKTAGVAMKELVSNGLVLEKRQYHNKPNSIYIRHAI